MVLTLGIAAATLATGATAVASVQAASHRVKMTLPRSIRPRPFFLTSGVCGFSGANDSERCNAAILRAIDDARKSEPLAAIPKDFNLAAFDRLNASDQIFVIADMERIERGLPPMAGITVQLDTIAQRAAAHQTDPYPILPLRIDGGGVATIFGSNWAEGTADPLGADYFWMYDDGLDSPNASCTRANESSCWGHRENVLKSWSSPTFCGGTAGHLLMGVGEAKRGVAMSPSLTELFINDCGRLPPLLFSWSHAERLVFQR
jgi:hypothetical protein